MTKVHFNDLAVFGGEPAFSEKLFVGRPNIGNREQLLERINTILDTRCLSNDGPLVGEFEKRIAQYLDVKHCIAMCNATIAMQILARAMGLKGEVIMPSFTFIASAHALEWQQITPVFSDIDPTKHLLDPDRLERAITSRTTAIMGVHLWGRVCDVEAIDHIARRQKLKVLFDAAHAFGCTHRGQKVGGFGDAEVFSFHATKFMNAFEGGAVTTNDDALARKVRLMKNFGFTYWDEVSYPGTNGKMTEVSAAMGLTSLENITEFINLNRRNYERYERQLEDRAGLQLLRYDPREENNYQYIVVEVDEDRAGMSRDQLLEVLWAENVIARRYFYPGCHRMEPYATMHPNAAIELPVTEEVTRRVLVLPTGTGVSPDQIDRLCRIIEFALEHATEVKHRLCHTHPPFVREEANVACGPDE